MKPTFALNLSNERVGLLHRTGRGWLQVGDVAFDTPDLPEALAYLRRTALGLAPRGVTTKLVIPNSQILYIDVEAPGPDDETRRKQIAKGLVGRTPYAPEDLVFDWRGKGTMVKVAVVARETLQEAEAFAVEHRFNPVSFVALPEASSFKGEPFFGMTEAAKGTLPKGETVDPDRDAMSIVTRDLPVADLAPEPEPEPKPARTTASVEADPAVADTTSVIADDLAPEPQVAATVADTIEAPVADIDVTPASMRPDPMVELAAAATASLTTLADNKTTVEEAPFAHVADPGGVTGDGLAAAEDDLPPAPSKAAQIAFASRRAADEPRIQAASTKPSLGEFPGPVKGDFRSDFVAKRPNGALKPDAQVTAPSIPGSKKRKGGPTAPPPAVAAAAAALAISGASGNTTKPLTRPGGTFGAKPLPRRGKPRFLGLILTGLLLFVLALVAAWSTYYMAQNDAGTEVDTAISVTPGDAPAIDDEIAADQPVVAPSSGATLPDDVASAVPSIDESTAGAVPEDSVAGNTVAPAPATAAILDDPEALADGEVGAVATDMTAPDDGTELTLADGATATQNVVADPPEPAPDAPVAATDADASAADGSAETTPPAPAAEVLAAAPDLDVGAAPQSRQADLPPDEIFLATTDLAPDFQDALVLPTPALSADAIPAASPPPPPFGTVYRFGDNGLIIPPPEGILSPEGIMLFAGAPPVTPPGRSPAVIAAAVAAAVPAPDVAPATDPTTASDVAPAIPADPAMAGFRPRPRPATLTTPAQENADDASLGTADVERTVTMRPRIRPDTILSTASAARNETANASLTAQSNAAVQEAMASAAATGNVMTLAVSRRPAAKPRDMSRAVEAAVAAAVRTPEPDPGQAEDDVASNALPEDDAEPELASAAPKIPTKTTVAKQATFANAINLSKINLIGVYGTQSKRYALIRLASGRYKKVSVGDSVDGGQVAAITATEVRYQKGGRLVSLKLPKT